MSAVADKLREARALIETHGWWQGTYHDGDEALAEIVRLGADIGRCCSLGAIGYVTHKVPDADDAPVLIFGKAIGFDLEEIDDHACFENAIAGWNDATERTQAEVLAAFDKAIALAQGIEAGTDTTTKIGVAEGESPVGSADAPGTHP